MSLFKLLELNFNVAQSKLSLGGFMKVLLSSCIVLTTFAIVSGCTTLAGGKTGGLAETPVKGFTYYLPAKVFETEIKFQITNCTPSTEEKIIPELFYKVNPVLTERIVADTSQSYTIDYLALNGKTKVTNSTFELYQNGMLKSINADAADKSGSIAANVIDAGFSVVRAAALGSPNPLHIDPKGLESIDFKRKDPLSNPGKSSQSVPKKQEPAAPPKEIFKCSDELNANIANLRKNEDQLVLEQAKDKTRSAAAETLTKAKSAVDIARGDLNFFNENKGTSQEISKATKLLHEKVAALDTAKQDLTDLKDSQTSKIATEIEKLNNKLTYSTKTIFDATSNENPVKLALKEETIKTFYDDQAFKAVLNKCKDKDKDKDINTCEKYWPSATVTVSPIIEGKISGLVKKDSTSSSSNSGQASDEKSVSSQPPKTLKGIYYRQPAEGRVTVCVPYCTADEIKSGHTSEKLVTQYLTSLPQSGQLSVLSLENEIFDENSIVATFSENGGLNTLTFHSKSQAEAASSAAANAGAKYNNLITNLIGDKKAQRAGARAEEKEILDSQSYRATSLANTSNTVRDSTGADVDDQIAVIKKLQELDALKAGTASKETLEKTSLEGEVAKVKLQIELQKLKKQLATESVQ